MAKITESLSIQLKLLKVVGVFPIEGWQHIQKYLFGLTFFLLMCFSLTIGKETYELKQLDTKIIAACVNGCCILTLTRYMNIRLKKSKIEKLLKDLDRVSFTVDTPVGREIYSKTVKYVKLFTKYVWIVFCVAVSCTMLQPLILWKFTLPFAAWYPSDYQHDLNTWTVMLLWEELLLINALVITFVVDTIPTVILLVIGGQLDMLGHQLQNLPSKSNEEWRKKFITCVKYHQMIRKICQQFEAIFSTLYLILAILSIFDLCGGIFAIVSMNSNASFINFVLIVGSIGFQIFWPCYMGDMVLEKSTSLQFKLYCSDWIILESIESRKLLIMFLTNLNHPIALRFGSIYMLNLNTFTKVFKCAYSLYAIVQRFTTN